MGPSGAVGNVPAHAYLQPGCHETIDCSVEKKLMMGEQLRPRLIPDSSPSRRIGNHEAWQVGESVMEPIFYFHWPLPGDNPAENTKRSQD